MDFDLLNRLTSPVGSETTLPASKSQKPENFTFFGAKNFLVHPIVLIFSGKNDFLIVRGMPWEFCQLVQFCANKVGLDFEIFFSFNRV